MKSSEEYQAIYYKRNRSRLLRKKAKRYKSDPSYREAIKRSVRRQRERRKNAGEEE